jgi:hypothetical protein
MAGSVIRRTHAETGATSMISLRLFQPSSCPW